ncbi:MAG: ribulose-bisphosphate carboxylase large subunit family protein [Burkholderiaceae bacterium]
MSRGQSDSQDRVIASYLMETALDPATVAAGIAGEQSSGTFIALPQEDEALLERAAARVEALTEVAAPEGSAARRYALTLSWPIGNFGASLPNLVATVAGNLFELKQVSALKLLDIVLPDAFAAAYPGPGFGIEGTRALSGVHGRPLIGTIIKPSVGLGPQDTAALVEQLCAGGIDFIKDDELQADGPACPFETRLRAVMDVIDRHADRSGQRVMYAVNITGELDEMQRRHDLVEKLGGTCVMVSLNSVGLVGFSALRKTTRLPIHAHRNGWGYLGRSPNHGWSYVAWQKLWRLAGADHMHVNGLSNKFWEPDDSVLASARACLTPMFETRPCLVMPVFSSAQSAKQVAPTWQALASPDLIYCAGGGIAAHPGGVAAGVLALRDAWQAAMNGVPVEQAARESQALRQALETFGR